jgi:DNA-binding NtrC family response regulator
VDTPNPTTETPVQEKQAETPQQLTFSFPRGTTLAQLEEMYLVEVMEMNEGNKTKVAKELGITVKTLYNKLHQLGLFEQYQDQKKVANAGQQ